MMVVMEDVQDVGDAAVTMVDTLKLIRLYCTHCGRYRHTRETCWDLMGMTLSALANPTESKEKKNSNNPCDQQNLLRDMISKV